MSMRRNTGRDRRAQSSAFNLARYYGATGITYDFDAASGITKDGSNRISAWVDKVSGLTLAQATGANQPLFVASSTPNGLPAVNISDAARGIQNSAMPALTAPKYTLFLALNHGASSDGFVMIRETAAARSGPNYKRVAGNRCAQHFGAVVLTDGAFSTANYEVVALQIEAAGGFNTNITTQNIFVNGTKSAMTGTGVFETLTVNGVLSFGFTATAAASASIARALLCESVLMGDSDIIAISNYLRSYYAVP